MIAITYSSELEERLAAHHAHYTWEQYTALTGVPAWCEDGEDSKTMVIATYRAYQHMVGVQQWR